MFRMKIIGNFIAVNFRFIFNSKLKKNFLFVQTFNPTLLEPENNAKMIAEIDCPDETKDNSGNFSIAISDDSSKVLVFYNLPYVKDKPESYGLQVYNNEMNLIWKNQETIPYNDNLFSIYEQIIDNQGNVWILGRRFDEVTKEKRQDEANYKFQLLCYSDNGNTFTEYPLHYDDKFLINMKIAITPNRDMICAGFYSTTGMNNAKGTYFLIIDDTTKTIKSINTKDFELDFILPGLGDITDEKTEKRTKKSGN
mgnify:CR=1 FL=1